MCQLFQEHKIDLSFENQHTYHNINKYKKDKTPCLSQYAEKRFVTTQNISLITTLSKLKQKGTFSGVYI